MKKTATKLITWISIPLMLLLAGCGDDSNPVSPPAGDVTISSISPASASAGATVTITGDGFSSTANENIVIFGGDAQAEVTGASSTKLTVVVPDGAEDGTITVKVGESTATSSESFSLGEQIPELYQNLPGTLISHDETWSSDTTLTGPRFVLPGATLTIKEGVTVTFTYHNNVSDNVGTIITLPGDTEHFNEPKPSGRLVAVGTADNPIVFTSDKKQVASWGGIILAGNASNNTKTGQGEIEGLSQGVQYGSADGTFKDDDDSGQLSYVQINYSGYSISEGSELQALTLYSVGSKTQLDHISIFKSVDDGIEFFGGTVDVKYYVVVDAQDDTFDGDQGWTGRGQFWLGVTTDGTPANRGWENDGCADQANCDGGNGPTEYKVYNSTMWGNGTPNGEDEVHGIFAREGLTGAYKNIIIANFQKPNALPVYVDIDDGTEQNIGSTLLFGGNYSYNNASNDYSDLPYSIDDVGVTVLQNLPFTDPANFDFSLVDGSEPATGAVDIPDDDFFTQVDFSGAVGVKGSNDDWTTGANWIKWND